MFLIEESALFMPMGMLRGRVQWIFAARLAEYYMKNNCENSVHKLNTTAVLCFY